MYGPHPRAALVAEDRDFLRAIVGSRHERRPLVAAPDDASVGWTLVGPAALYADWLEERGRDAEAARWRTSERPRTEALHTLLREPGDCRFFPCSLRRDLMTCAVCGRRERYTPVERREPRRCEGWGVNETLATTLVARIEVATDFEPDDARRFRERLEVTIDAFLGRWERRVADTRFRRVTAPASQPREGARRSVLFAPHSRTPGREAAFVNHTGFGDREPPEEAIV